jgi:hypothetical protein
LLRRSIPIRGEWTEEGPGWLELDTVALCGSALDDRHAWMLDAVEIRTDWGELRVLENRSQHCTLTQIRDLGPEESVPHIDTTVSPAAGPTTGSTSSPPSPSVAGPQSTSASWSPPPATHIA